MILRPAARIAVSTMALVMTVAGCGDDDAVGSVEPVFALDRDIVAGLVDAPSTQSVIMPAFELRLALQSLLTEHATLSNEAMRRAIDGGPFDDTLTELTRNTDDLTLAIGMIYGPDGASAFDQLWTNHIEFFNDYGRAMAAGDDVAAQAIRTGLGHYEHDFSDFVEVATGGELDFETVLQVLHSHVDQLLAQADAWEAGDHARATAGAAEAYAHMDVIAGALAGAIAAQQPDRFPGRVDTAAHADCAATRLSLGATIVAGADVELADRSGDAASLAAADQALAAAVADTREWIGDDGVEQIIGAMTIFDEAGSIPSARARLQSAEVDRLSATACAEVR